jgi:WD40 repeat protein
VLLIGTGSYAPGSGLPEVPAVEATLADLKEALVAECHMQPERIRVGLDPATPVELGEAVADEAERAEGLLVVFFVGHGLISQKGELYLATQRTNRSPTRLETTAFRYDTLRQILQEYRDGRTGRSLIVMLDCCFSGRAHDALSGPDDAENLTDIRGVYVLTSAGRDELALAPVGARHTAFTGGLIRLLTSGDPDGPPDLTLHDAYRYLARTLPGEGFPRPRNISTDRAGELILAVNHAYRPRPVSLRPSLPDAAPVPVSGRCPYQGLSSFGTEDARWFFGRERLTTLLVRRLSVQYDLAAPLVLVGASGAGKSSVLRAGLLPALRRGELAIARSGTWPVSLFTPTADPVGMLAAKAEALTGMPADLVAADIRADPRWLAAALRTAVAPRLGHGSVGDRVVLIVDQFEEIFTQCTREHDRSLFVQALAVAADGDRGEPAALVVLAVRADFYGRCANYPELIPAMEGNPIVVAAMTPAELRAAIEKPAAAAGMAIEPGLTELLLADLGVHGHAGPDTDDPNTAGAEHDAVTPRPAAAYDAGRLPLLSHALYMTWRQREGAAVTVAGYLRAGGIQEALSATADHALAKLDEAGRTIARSLLLRLVHIGEGADDTRRRVSRSQLLADVPDPEQAAAVLDILVADDTRLVTVEQDAVQLTHDAILHAWPTLRRWIDTNRAELVIQQQLDEAARAWERDDRDRSGLYRGNRLAVADDWANTDQRRDRLSPVVRGFLDASIRERRRVARRRQGIYTTLVLALVTVVLAAGTEALRQRHAAEQQRRLAASQRMLREAESIRATQPARSLLLTAAALSIDDRPEVRASLLSALAHEQYAGTLRHQDPVRAAVFGADNYTVVTAAGSEAVLWDIRDLVHPQRIATFAAGGAPERALALSPDGRTAATGDAAGNVALWNLPDQLVAPGGHPRTVDPVTVRPLATRTLHTGSVYAVAFSSDGTLLATGGVDGRVAVTDVSESGTPRRAVTFATKTGQVRSLAFVGDRRTLVIGTDTGATLWTIANRSHPSILAELSPPIKAQQTVSVFAVASALNGRLNGVADRNGNVSLWDLSRTDHPIRLATVNGGVGSVRALTFRTDGRTMAVGGDDHTATLWQLADPRHPRRQDKLVWHKDVVLAAALSPDGKILVTGSDDKTAGLWRTAEPVQPNIIGTTSLAELAPEAASRRRVILWNRDDAHPPIVLNIDADTVTASHDGRLAVAVTRDSVTLWDISDRTRPTRLATIPQPIPTVYQPGDVSAVFSPDNSILAIEGDHDILLWDISDPQRPTWQSTLANSATGSPVAFTPDQQTLITSTNDPARETVEIWDIGNPNRPTLQAELSHQLADSEALSSNGRILATRNRDRGASTVLWDIGDKKHPARLGVVPGPQAVFSPDGRILATTDERPSSVVLWNIDAQRYPIRVAPLSGPQGRPAFSPSGRVIATRVDDSLVFWDIGWLTDIISHPKQTACDLAGQELSPQEWSTYAPELRSKPPCGR